MQQYDFDSCTLHNGVRVGVCSIFYFFFQRGKKSRENCIKPDHKRLTDTSMLGSDQMEKKKRRCGKVRGGEEKGFCILKSFASVVLLF